MAEELTRNLGMELVRATEVAAMEAARWTGRGDKNAADQSAVQALRAALNPVAMHGVVVSGEGEKDEAPMLYVGEVVGHRPVPDVDIAVDPIDGARLTALGLPGAIAVIVAAPRGRSTPRRRASTTWRRSPLAPRPAGRLTSRARSRTISSASLPRRGVPRPM
jgi:hypothetical protein